jgi:hypothetical protein
VANPFAGNISRTVFPLDHSGACREYQNLLELKILHDYCINKDHTERN